jgi:pyruvate-formate lyase-activating enzyme
VSDHIPRIKEIQTLTDNISKTFCLAKWHHTTIYLHTGQTHSCYHPKPHAIPLEELKDNPSALHNTLHKKKERAQMLTGVKCNGCQYCWNVEDLSADHISDRMIRNESIYSSDRMEELLSNPWDYNVNPEYIEIAFSNECNFKCGYCHPMASSSFHNEIKKFGPFETVKNHRLDVDWFKPMEEHENPYVRAWWEWWPEVSKTLNILRITGGEPLMHKSTWRLFETLQEEPRPQLELNVNSNLGIKPALVEKLTENVNALLKEEKIKKFKLFTSVDTWGKRAEYLRTGLNLTTWEKNLKTYLTNVDGEVTFMCTFNILSVTSFVELLEKILELRNEFYHPKRHLVRFDTPYLKEPLQYDMHILPKDEFLPYFDKILDFIKENMDNTDTRKFSELEYEKFKRVRDYFATVQYDTDRVTEGRIDFYNWFNEYDRRRKTNFLETFPEMKEFYNLCKTLYEGKSKK